MLDYSFASKFDIKKLWHKTAFVGVINGFLREWTYRSFFSFFLSIFSFSRFNHFYWSQKFQTSLFWHSKRHRTDTKECAVRYGKINRTWLRKKFDYKYSWLSVSIILCIRRKFYFNTWLNHFYCNPYFQFISNELFYFKHFFHPL